MLLLPGEGEGQIQVRLVLPGEEEHAAAELLSGVQLQPGDDAWDKTAATGQFDNITRFTDIIRLAEKQI